MSKEIILKKIEQLKALLAELESLLQKGAEDFINDTVVIRAAERNFQLIVELAGDINTTLLVDKTGKTPDTYRQSFSDIEKLGVIDADLAAVMATSAKLRNILVHEYDFEEDYERFYISAKEIAPSYQKYIEAMLKYMA